MAWNTNNGISETRAGVQPVLHWTRLQNIKRLLEFIATQFFLGVLHKLCFLFVYKFECEMLLKLFSICVYCIDNVMKVELEYTIQSTLNNFICMTP